MSFFTTDVVAKEQLPGVAGLPTPAVPPPGYAFGGVITIKRKPFSLDLLRLLGRWLEVKLHGEAEADAAARQAGAR